MKSGSRSGMAGLVALAALLLAGAPVQAQAQAASISGRVATEQGEAVAGARVQAQGAGAARAATTDGEGRYVLRVAAPGAYRVSVRAQGFRPAEREVALAGDAATADFTLTADPVALSGLVVTATRSSTPVEAIPGAVTVVTREQIGAQAELTPRMGDVLTQLVPGLSAGTQSMSNYGQSFRGRSVVVLIDGVPQSTSRNGMRDFVTIDPAMVERVEVLRGATSIYGEGATGGLINVITRRGTGGPLRFSTDVSTQSSLSATGEGLAGRVAQTVSGGRGIFDFMAAGSLTRGSGFHDAEGDRIPSDPHGQGGVADMDAWDVFGKVGADLGAQRLELTANYFRAEQETEFASDPAVNAPGSDATKARALPGLDLQDGHGSENLLLNLDFSRANFLGSRLHAQAYYRDYLTRFGPYDGRTLASLGNSIIQSYIDSQKRGGRLELETTLPLASSPSLLWGVDFHDETTSQPVAVMDTALYRSSGGLVFRKVGERPWTPPLDTRSLGLFAQLAWNPAERVMLRGGVRHERARVSADDFTTIQGARAEGGHLDYAPVLFNAGAVVEVVDGGSLYASFSQGFSLADIGRLLRGVPDGFVLGSDGYEAQKVDQYEVGARARWRRAEATVSAFRNESEQGATFNAALEIERAPERVYGVEATLDASPTDALTLGGTFTWTEGERLPAGAAEWLPLDGYRIQPRKVTAYVEHRTLPRWNNRLQLLHSGSRDRLFEENPQAYGSARVESYTVVDALSTLEVGPGTLSIGVENLLNAQYFPVVSQLEAQYGAFRNAAARGATLSVGYSVRY